MWWGWQSREWALGHVHRSMVAVQWAWHEPDRHVITKGKAIWYVKWSEKCVEFEYGGGFVTMWLSASSRDSQSHLLITFYLTCDILLSSPLLLSLTVNLHSHSMTFSHPLLSLSPLPFATLPILWFTTLPIIPTPCPTPLSNYLCHHSLHICHSH